MGASDLELEILSMLEETDRPLGAVTMYYRLKQKHKAGQATVGRKLLELDTRGLTKRHAYAGRTITPEGKKFLREVRESRQMRREQDALSNSLSYTDLQGLLQVLEARRGLEVFSAYLAATRASEEDLKLMAQIISNDLNVEERPGASDAYDVMFHEAVAKATGNPVLEHTVRLVRQASAFSPMVVSILLKEYQSTGNRCMDLHHIYEAIKDRDPERARQAMDRHIQNMTQVVQRFWATEAQHFVATTLKASEATSGREESDLQHHS